MIFTNTVTWSLADILSTSNLILLSFIVVSFAYFYVIRNLFDILLSLDISLPVAAITC